MFLKEKQTHMCWYGSLPKRGVDGGYHPAVLPRTGRKDKGLHWAALQRLMMYQGQRRYWGMNIRWFLAFVNYLNFPITRRYLSSASLSIFYPSTLNEK